MRQRDIERVMAAAWDAATLIPGGQFRLLVLLREVDPHGVYRPDGAQHPGADEPYVPLRESPRLLCADEAGGHE